MIIIIIVPNLDLSECCNACILSSSSLGKFFNNFSDILFAYGNVGTNGIYDDFEKQPISLK